MNIFVLSRSPARAAEMACDQHVVKMPTETAQMLSTVLRQLCVEVGYKSSHAKHPCTLWAGATADNFSWLVEHGRALCFEYTWRYHKVHAAKEVIVACSEYVSKVPAGPLTPFAQAMPEVYRQPDAVKAYRAYYIGEKLKFARWAKTRGTPSWVIR